MDKRFEIQADVFIGANGRSLLISAQPEPTDAYGTVLEGAVHPLGRAWACPLQAT